MKNKIIFSISLLILLGISFYIFSTYSQNGSADLSSSLRIYVKSPKPAYILGEIVVLEFELRNESSSDIWLPGTDAQSGYLKILVSNSEENFKEYTNAAWGNKKQPSKNLKAGQTIRSQATVLVNAKPAVSHLNENAARLVSEGKIITDYAFPEAGVYYIKAVLIIPREESLIKIESNPIQITVSEPMGEDLEVWNKIKDRSDIAYFMQEGSIIARNEEEKENFLQEVKQLVVKYPNSPLTNQLQRSLEKFQDNEERRRKFMEKLKRPQ